MPKTPDRLFVRPPWERMMHIHERIKSGTHPNCRQLAAELEICIRTVKRDLVFMKYRLKLPIEYHPQRYGFYYSEPVDQFPDVAITESELFALLVAHKAIAQYRGTPFQRILETAFKKLSGQLDTETRFSLGNLDDAFSFCPFAPEDADLKTFELLSRAVRERRMVRFQYRNLGAKQAQRRRVQPYHLACIDYAQLLCELGLFFSPGGVEEAWRSLENPLVPGLA